MLEKTLQETLIEEFFNERYFGDQHDFAARAEILALRERVAELETQIGGKAGKGRPAPADKSE